MNFLKYIFGVLSLIATLVWLAVWQLPDDNLHLIACDVGQGDAILAVYKNIQILTDGGPPNGKLARCLSRHMPFWDREVEVVVNTHPQADHFGGLIDLFKNYKVDYFIANAIDSSAPEYQLLKKEVGGSGTKVVNPVAGTSVRLGMISYDIFWPTNDFLAGEGYDFLPGKLGTFTSKRDPNDFSVQAVLSLGKFSALLTGDIGSSMAGKVLQNLPGRVIDYIKIPHHGSKNGMTQDYLNVIEPKVAVISVGAKNTYGHPTPEILKILNDKGIKILRTDEAGDIEIVINRTGNLVSL